MLPRPPLSTRPATLFPYTPLFRSTRRGRNMRAFIFPGQGSQSVGMGKALAEASSHAREVFQEVDDALGQKLFQLMSDGPEDQLTLTEKDRKSTRRNSSHKCATRMPDYAGKKKKENRTKRRKD